MSSIAIKYSLVHIVVFDYIPFPITLHVDKFSCPSLCVEHDASKYAPMSACVIICTCVYVQINYADMLKRVEPLRDELHSLELQAQENKNRGEQVTNLIMQLEHSIASYKEEYAQLISQAQAIKTDLENVQAKVHFMRLLYRVRQKELPYLRSE